MRWKALLVLAACLWIVLIGINHAHSGYGNFNGELSFTINFSRTDFGNNAYSTARRYTTALGVNLTPVTIIELSYFYSDTFFNQDPVQTTSINDQALGLSLIQAIVPPDWVIQPYVKAGAAQYNRKQSGTVAGIPTRETTTMSPSALIGGGVRIFLLRNFSLKLEGVTYLPDLKFSQANKNFGVEGGFGWHF